MKRHWVRLQLRFESPNTIASGVLKCQYIAIIATFSSLFFMNFSFRSCGDEAGNTSLFEHILSVCISLIIPYLSLFCCFLWCVNVLFVVCVFAMCWLTCLLMGFKSLVSVFCLYLIYFIEVSLFTLILHSFTNVHLSDGRIMQKHFKCFSWNFVGLQTTIVGRALSSLGLILLKVANR